MSPKILAAFCFLTSSAFATVSYNFRTDVQGTPSLKGSNVDLSWTLVDFSSATGDYGPAFSQSSLTLNGVTFATTGVFSILGSTLKLLNGNTVTITLPGNAYAFGADYAGIPGAQVTLAFTGDGAPATPLNSAFVSTSQFSGSRVTTSISPLTLSNTFFELRLSNFEIGTLDTVSETPEPGTVVLIGAGLAALLAMRVWRRTP